MTDHPLLDQVEMLSDRILDSIRNASTRSMYRKGLGDFTTWWRSQNQVTLDINLIAAHIACLLKLDYSPATVNQQLAAISKLIGQAAEKGLPNLGIASKTIRVSGILERPNPNKTSLNSRQTETLINAPQPSTKRGLKDRALLGLLPQWTKVALDAWLQSANLKQGSIFLALNRYGTPFAYAISPQAILPIVRACGPSIGLDVKPDGLRRTCAQLCRANGGELEQIQLLLGHAGIQTTKRYLGNKPKTAVAANERLRLRWCVGKKLES